MTVPMSTFSADKPTLLMSYWCTFYAITIILFRVGGRFVRVEKLFIEDGVMLFTIVLLLLRMGFAHAVLLYGTNNIDPSMNLSAAAISSREFGSKMVLVARILYPTCLWTIKLSAALFLNRLTGQFWHATSGNMKSTRVLQRHLIHFLHALMTVTIVGVVATNLSICQPFSHYWQYEQLISMGTLNMATDLAIIILPLPMLLRAKISRKSKIALVFLLIFPSINVAFTAYRLKGVVAHNGSQQYRTLMASIDLLVAVISSNILMVTTFLQDKGMKKTKYKYDPEVENKKDGEIETARLLAVANANGSPAERHMAKQVLRQRWGSDEDLMRNDDGMSNGGRTLDGSNSIKHNSSVFSVKDIELENLPQHPKRVASLLTHSSSTHKPRGHILIETTWQVDTENVKDIDGDSKRAV